MGFRRFKIRQTIFFFIHDISCFTIMHTETQIRALVNLVVLWVIYLQMYLSIQKFLVHVLYLLLNVVCGFSCLFVFLFCFNFVFDIWNNVLIVVVLEEVKIYFYYFQIVCTGTLVGSRPRPVQEYPTVLLPNIYQTFRLKMAL